jgi:hypothetical protein
MIALSLAYLVPFVPRGWIPHDEGMLGQSAERLLRGDMPHVDYQETYTGGLTWLYAAVFRFGRIDLLTLRWTLFAGAALAQVVTYCHSETLPRARAQRPSSHGWRSPGVFRISLRGCRRGGS